MITEIVSDIKRLTVDCPDCKYVIGDEQYTCPVCWSEGGNGQINVFHWLKDHIEVLLNENQKIING